MKHWKLIRINRLKPEIMQSFEMELSFQARDKQEAATVMKSLAVMARKLKPRELEKLAEVVESKPVTLAIAKKYLGL
jgi:hypothetical protein